MWLSSSEPPRLRAGSIRYPSFQIPSLTFSRRFCSLWFSSSCLSVWSWLSWSVPLIWFWWELGCFLLIWANHDISPWHAGCSCHIHVLLFPNLCISSKSLLGLSFHEAALCGGCNVMSFQANDRLIYSSVALLFSLMITDWENCIFSMCVVP